MNIKPIYIFFAAILISCLFEFTVSDSNMPILSRILIAVLFGIGVGIMAFNDKTEPMIAKLCGAGVAFFFLLAFIALYALSEEATSGTLITGFFLAGIMYWAVSRTQ